MLGHESFRFRNGFFYGQSVEGETIKRSGTIGRRIANNAFFCIKTFFAHIGAFDKRNNREVEMTGKSIVATVVSWHCHNRTGAVSCEHIV